MHGILEDLDLPFDLPAAEACDDPESNLMCPLVEGVETSYHATLPVLVIYPTVRHHFLIYCSIKLKFLNLILITDFPNGKMGVKRSR